jgi:hypothetical protein
MLELAKFEPTILLAGGEVILEDGEQQEAVVSKTGWKHIIVWNPNDGTRFGH